MDKIRKISGRNEDLREGTKERRLSRNKHDIETAESQTDKCTRNTPRGHRDSIQKHPNGNAN